MASPYKYNELKKLVTRGNNSFVDIIEYIEKHLEPTWVRFSDGIKNFNFPLLNPEHRQMHKENEKHKELPILTHQAQKEFAKKINEFYFTLIDELRIIENKSDRSKINESGISINFYPKTGNDWIKFNNYIIEKYFPSYESLIQGFEKRSGRVGHTNFLLQKEIAEYDCFANSKFEQVLSFDFFDIEYVKTNEYNWNDRFCLAFQSVVNKGNPIGFDKYIRLPDLYFLHLGTIYGLFYNFLNTKLMAPTKKNSTHSLNTIGEKILFIKYTGILELLKKKIGTTTNLNENLLQALAILLNENSESIKPVIAGIGQSPNEINKNNPYTKKASDKIQFLLRELNFDVDANKLNTEFKKINLSKE